MDYHIKFRPDTYDEVLGQDKQVASIRKAVKSGNQSFILAGPSGVGKTTLARIIANEIKCTHDNRIEVDAATHTGIDPMRELTRSMNFKSISGNTKIYIIDEAHALSKAAWQSLLKSVEEPPDGVFWVFCTTELNKIPKTIQTRCLVYNLSSVSSDIIFDLLVFIKAEEELEIEDSWLELIAKNSDGSPRQALTSLSVCETCTSKKEVAQMLETVESENEVIELCRVLIAHEAWKKVITLVDSLIKQEVAPESIRRIILQYFMSVIKNPNTKNQMTVFCLQVFEAFKEAIYDTKAYYSIFLALGELYYSE